MNESLFFLHILFVAAASLAALRLGKTALVALVALESVLANVFVVKQTTLFGLHVTCSDVYIVGSLLSLNLLQEFFGKESAQRAIKISFFTMVVFVVMVKFHLHYAPSSFDASQDAFQRIFTHTLRIIVASMFVYYVTQQIDVRFFGWLKSRFQERYLGLRIGLSLVLSQTIDTFLFSFVGLFGVVANLGEIIVMSLIVKCVAIACCAPFSMLSRKFTPPSLVEKQ